MKLHVRRVGRVLCAAALTLTVLATAVPAPLPADRPAVGETPTAAKGETRLRKLHLVRPDLIPYPIAFEVYC